MLEKSHLWSLANFNFFSEGNLPISTLYDYLVVWGPVVWIFWDPRKWKGLVLGDTPIRIPNHRVSKPQTFCESVGLGVEHPRKKYVTSWIEHSWQDGCSEVVCNHQPSQPPKKPNKTYKKVTSSWKLQKHRNNSPLKKHTFDLLICAWPKKQQ